MNLVRPCRATFLKGAFSATFEELKSLRTLSPTKAPRIHRSAPRQVLKPIRSQGFTRPVPGRRAPRFGFTRRRVSRTPPLPSVSKPTQEGVCEVPVPLIEGGSEDSRQPERLSPCSNCHREGAPSLTSPPPARGERGYGKLARQGLCPYWTSLASTRRVPVTEHFAEETQAARLSLEGIVTESSPKALPQPLVALESRGPVALIVSPRITHPAVPFRGPLS